MESPMSNGILKKFLILNKLSPMSNLKHLSPKPGVNLIAVEVPEGAMGFELFVDYVNDGLQNDLWWRMPLKLKGLFEHKFLTIPPGKYTILGIATELPEEVVRELVETTIKYGLTFYKEYCMVSGLYTRTPLESFQSFCKANGLDKGRWLVMEVK